MKQNAPGGFLNSRGVNIALGSLLVLNTVLIVQILMLLAFEGFVYIVVGSSYRER